jgi:hypothetical protein
MQILNRLGHKQRRRSDPGVTSLGFWPADNPLWSGNSRMSVDSGGGPIDRAQRGMLGFWRFRLGTSSR